MKSEGSLELISGPMFSGKCLAKDTPIIMFDGNIKMVQDIKIGDTLIGDDSEPRNVLSICQGNSELFRVTPLDENGADPYIINEHHILSLKCYQTNKVVNISVKEYLQKSDTFKKCHKGYKIGVDFNYVPVPIDPYVLGKWIGYELNKGSNNLKEIPLHYKANCRGILLLLLAGILDVNSHYIPEINAVLINVKLCKSAIMIKDILFIARSLGFIAYHRDSNIYIKGNISEILCKNLKLIDSLNNNLLYDIDIKSVGTGDYFGFEIDGNHLFLLGDFTVTHNTTELLRRLSCDLSIKRNILYINHSFDERYIEKTEGFSTHNPLYKEKLIGITMMKCLSLPSLEDIKNFDTIGIDEAQFFDNLDNVKNYVEEGRKRVIVGGLIADSNRQKFGHISDLIEFCDTYTQLYASCILCGEKNKIVHALFSHRISGNKNEQIYVGSMDKYIPVCRKHYIQLNKNEI